MFSQFKDLRGNYKSNNMWINQLKRCLLPVSVLSFPRGYMNVLAMTQKTVLERCEMLETSMLS